jgi:dATP pyrophosphohydrolase
MYQLDAQCMVPSAKVCGLWGPDILEISEHAFAVAVEGPELHIRKEHSEYRWVTYEEELRHLHWDSNRVPLGELSQRLTARDEI